jgi:hypothetical protein
VLWLGIVFFFQLVFLWRGSLRAIHVCRLTIGTTEIISPREVLQSRITLQRVRFKLESAGLTVIHTRMGTRAAIGW